MSRNPYVNVAQPFSSVGVVWMACVKSVESGEIVRFMYHVVAVERAKALYEKNVDPGSWSHRKGSKVNRPVV